MSIEVGVRVQVITTLPVLKATPSATSPVLETPEMSSLRTSMNRRIACVLHHHPPEAARSRASRCMRAGHVRWYCSCEMTIAYRVTGSGSCVYHDLGRSGQGRRLGPV